MEPVVVTYLRPRERVLFNYGRDANPFFHLFESLWMLAGRDDVGPVMAFNQRIKTYSDDGVTFHGAYGYRWRCAFGYDQLSEILAELREDPGSRRCVLEIWNAATSMGTPHDMAMALSGGKDIPCNTHAYFAVGEHGLDITVCNRSNDLVWGLLGANVVHFSLLQEYMAASLRCPVGRYHHVTNNLHAYLKTWNPRAWSQGGMETIYDQEEPLGPMVSGGPEFDSECCAFVDSLGRGDFHDPFLRGVASPMCCAFHAHKQRDYEAAYAFLEKVEAWDWRLAGADWIRRRQMKWLEKTNQGDCNGQIYTERERTRTRVD